MAAAIALALGTVAGKPVGAMVVDLDTFRVGVTGATLDGSTGLINDTFSDGIAPPNLSGFACGATAPNCYFTLGTITESGNRAHLDTALGIVSADATGDLRRRVFGQPRSQVTPAGSNIGLRQGDATHPITFAVTGTFDLHLPTVSGESYGITLGERIASGPFATPGDDLLNLVVRNVGGIVEVAFDEIDFVAGAIMTISSETLPTIVGVDQIVLRLIRNNASTNEITARYQLLDNDLGSPIVYDKIFATTGDPRATIFNGEDYTLAGFFANAPVPEPAGLGFLGLGLAMLGMLKPRRRKAPEGRRI